GRHMNRDFLLAVEGAASLILFILGTALTTLSLGAEMLALNLTPGFGVVQMVQLLLGLTCLSLAGYLRIHSLRPPGTPRSLQADIGVRLGATGLVLAYVSGLADLIGIGTHIEPEFARPYVGPLQLSGLIIGVLMLTAGLLLYYTSRGRRPHSALRSLLPNRHEHG
ncbi:MAG: hypothetical protein ACRDHL_14305, partial [Candidatus Promineifilaceae bacterium]